MGQFPQHIVVGGLTVGGRELIPPIGIMQRPNYDSLAPEIKEWLIDIKLRHKEISSLSARLAAVAMVLSEILSHETTEVPKGLDSTIPVEGLVVIGRNKIMPQDKRRFFILNSTRHVKLITYDELLEKLEILIQTLESLV